MSKKLLIVKLSTNTIEFQSKSSCPQCTTRFLEIIRNELDKQLRQGLPDEEGILCESHINKH